MTKMPLIYQRGPGVRLIDPEREILIGVFDDYEQAQRGWAAYIGQGRVSEGFDTNADDDYVIDMWRRDSQRFIARCVMKGS
jgi:hypothetical protein